ncbi:hypothetical protein MTO96_033319 [Rhipicephalus appendiculatus]
MNAASHNGGTPRHDQPSRAWIRQRKAVLGSDPRHARRHASAALNSLAGGASTTSPIQIHSTSDTASYVPVFDGTSQQSAMQWTTQVERIATLAHWTPSLTLVSAANRLAGSATEWNSTYSWRHDISVEWKDALTQRFRPRLTMQLQAKRRLGDNETILEYMYSKKQFSTRRRTD